MRSFNRSKSAARVGPAHHLAEHILQRTIKRGGHLPGIVAADRFRRAEHLRRKDPAGRRIDEPRRIFDHDLAASAIEMEGAQFANQSTVAIDPGAGPAHRAAGILKRLDEAELDETRQPV